MSSASLSSSDIWIYQQDIVETAGDKTGLSGWPSDKSVQVCPECSTSPVACWPLAHEELIRPLTGFVFHPAG